MTIIEDRQAVQMSQFAETIFKQKYSLNGEESWEECAARVVDNVMRPHFPEKADDMIKAIIERKFMPGGRYLYASGKPTHQTQNCLLLTVEDSREGWADLVGRVTKGLMTGAGIGIVYSELREEGEIDSTQYRELYNKSRGGEFRSVRYMMNYLENEYGES